MRDGFSDGCWIVRMMKCPCFVAPGIVDGRLLVALHKLLNWNVDGQVLAGAYRCRHGVVQPTVRCEICSFRQVDAVVEPAVVAIGKRDDYFPLVLRYPVEGNAIALQKVRRHECCFVPHECSTLVKAGW